MILAFLRLKIFYNTRNIGTVVNIGFFVGSSLRLIIPWL